MALLVVEPDEDPRGKGVLAIEVEGCGRCRPRARRIPRVFETSRMPSQQTRRTALERGVEAPVVGHEAYEHGSGSVFLVRSQREVGKRRDHLRIVGAQMVQPQPEIRGVSRVLQLLLEGSPDLQQSGMNEPCRTQRVPLAKRLAIPSGAGQRHHTVYRSHHVTSGAPIGRATPGLSPDLRVMIKYLGSKRLLVPQLLAVFAAVAPTGTVLDLFSGTSRVGHALKRHGYRVLANDHNAYAEVLGRCYVAADAEDWLERAGTLIRELSSLPGDPGYFTETFCERSRFFQPKNGARIDAIREEIRRRSLHPELEAIALVSLMEAADRVDSTTGLQMAYLKSWAPRAANDLTLRVPQILPRASAGKGASTGLDALDAIEQLDGDIAYLDPPYNQHKYLGNYHVWETLVRWDRPEVYGVACKRVDCRQRTSAFNARPRAHDALARLIRGVRARHVVVSFNDEGYLSRADVEQMLAVRGWVLVLAHNFPRYVGAQIGIHNPRGEKVGTVSHLRNTEHIFVATPDEEVRNRLVTLGAAVAV